MFESARMKLTLWYLAIIMAISIAFSMVIFLGSTREFNRLLRAQEYRITHPEYRVKPLPGNLFQLEPDDIPGKIDPQVIAEEKNRLLLELIGVNTVILLVSALAGYFLAGRTLKPIKVMVDEQRQFVTDASHELNTPLTSLKTTIEVNLRSRELSVNKAREVLASNLEDVNTLQSLTEELMTLAHLEEAHSHSPAVSSLQTCVQQARKTVAAVAKSKEITFSIAKIDATITASPKDLTELFVILFDNAIKYSPEKQSVTVGVAVVANRVKIIVKDRGIGIAKEDIAHIFDRFYRADKSRTKQVTPGYGLGLSIAKRIVSKYRGSINVESKLGEGSTFYLEFPLS